MQLPNKTAAPGRRHSALIVRAIVIALCSATVISRVCCSSIGASPEEAAVKLAETGAPPPPQQQQLKPEQPEAKSAAAAPEPVEQAKPAEPTKAAESAPTAAEQTRKGRSEAASAATGGESAKASSPAEPGKPAAPSKPAAEQKAAPAPAKPASSASAPQSKQLGGKSGAPSGPSASPPKKLPANLGTVTSTGSGGPAHYMSKHDAYSAIAEKHGALAQDAMRKADKRNHNLQRFGGIQKASGFGDALNPFKSVTDGGLARTLGAYGRSIMKGKYSIPAYVASAVLGAVALMAFYESPISPLPVPALPEPPVGRFPPEMPVISPNLQVPFRVNGQQQQQQQYGQQYYGQQNGYNNQRSFQAGQQQQQQQQPSQVLFPGAMAQPAQQRQGVAAGPVQQLAANLISSVGANRQTAQRKSGADTDAASSRSFFGSSSSAQPNKLNAPANQQHKGNSILSFLGLGGSGASPSGQSGSQSAPLGDIHTASSAGSHSVAHSSGHDQAGSLSGSHLVNKMKSYFDRPAAAAPNNWSTNSGASGHYDQYKRMSIMQALAKDTAFISSFFTPSRRSSNATNTSGAMAPLQQSINAVLSSASGLSAPSSGASQQVASSRMQVDSVLPSLLPTSPFSQPPVPSQPASPVKRASSGYGLMRAADRVAHALLDTFTSGLLHRSSEASPKKTSTSSLEEQQQQNALVSATTLLSDIMSSYSAAQQASNELSSAVAAAAPIQPLSQSDSGAKQPAELVGEQSASGRSAESSQPMKTAPNAEQSSPSSQQAKAPTAASQSSAPVAEQQRPSVASAGQPQQALNRKVRSIGLDYPMEPTTLQLQAQQQQQQQQPSRATQINNLVDFVSDSYKQNKLLFSFVMNQVGLSQALPYVDQFLGNPHESKERHFS